MILNTRFAPRLSMKSTALVALLALLVLPASLQFTRTEIRADEATPPKSEPTPAATPASEFPYQVKFEQGATRFEEGDDITIVEVRGTAETFTPGHLYWIKGTYKLASHNRGQLAAYITAWDREHAISTPFKVQHATVDQGTGNFTLFLPMLHRGWPHVSFYTTSDEPQMPADASPIAQLQRAQTELLWRQVDLLKQRAMLDPELKRSADELERQLVKSIGPRRARSAGEGFGGNYFGTGDYVMKKWWDEKEQTSTSVKR